MLVGPTTFFDPGLMHRVHAMLDIVFDGELTDDDWAHLLGGTHVIALEDGEPIGHASVVKRTMLIDGRPVSTGYVEGVGVRADRRRRGIAGEMMDVLEGVIAEEYELGALSSTDDAFMMYLERGWLLWRGPLSVATPYGVIDTPDEIGCVFVLPVAGAVDVLSEMTCDWRGGDVW